MNPEDMSPEQWTDQQHAEALEALQHAGAYVLAVVTDDGIKLLDGLPGSSGSSNHEQLCLFSMLEGCAATHRKLVERQMVESTESWWYGLQ
jgi:hypothetical protein